MLCWARPVSITSGPGFQTVDSLPKTQFRETNPHVRPFHASSSSRKPPKFLACFTLPILGTWGSLIHTKLYCPVLGRLTGKVVGSFPPSRYPLRRFLGEAAFTLPPSSPFKTSCLFPPRHWPPLRLFYLLIANLLSEALSVLFTIVSVTPITQVGITNQGWWQLPHQPGRRHRHPQLEQPAFCPQGHFTATCFTLASPSHRSFQEPHLQRTQKHPFSNPSAVWIHMKVQRWDEGGSF